ncbi:MAG: LysR family transcriptional regulator [Rhizobiaceae bacterium]|nr:LysR family transcriptional regulator [Rhizobiaceae bacterium]
MSAPHVPQIPLLELDLLKTLVAINDTGNFSAAAQVVYRTPSAVSMQVKRMEELLGRAVFVRDSRTVTLTRDGEILLSHARRVLALNREVVAQFITPEVAGIVRLGAPDEAAERFLPMMLKRFGETHPGIIVDVIVEGSTSLVQQVKQGQIDIALLTCEKSSDGKDGVEVLYLEDLVWAGAKGGIAVENNPLPVSVWDKGCVWRKAGLEGLAAQAREFRIAFQSAHISGQKAAILADLAVAPLPRSSIRGDIVAIDKKHNLPKLPQYALGMTVTPNASAPVKAAADHLRASFAGC